MASARGRENQGNRDRRFGPGDMEDNAPRARRFQASTDSISPGYPDNAGFILRPIHPRHPRASLSGTDVTSRVSSQQEMGPQRPAPPIPRASNEVAGPGPISTEVHGESRSQEDSRAIPGTSPDQHWPLGVPPPPRPVVPDPFVLAPERQRAPPQRPPRPSQGLSIEDISYLEDSTRSIRPSVPSIIDHQDLEPRAEPAPARRPPRYVAFPLSMPPQVESISEVPEESSQSSRASTLGPPPSSRRGRSTLYPGAIHVSPIVEEMNSTGSHTSYASSFGMPDFIYGNSGEFDVSPEGSQHDEHTHDEHQLMGGSFDFGDERRSAAGSGPENLHQAMASHHDHLRSFSPSHNPFNGNTSFMDISAESPSDQKQSETPETDRRTTSRLLETPVTVTDAVQSTCASDSEEWHEATGSPQPVRRLQAGKRPPRLDIDAVRAAEARGSLTSLPDLILRATRLAAMIELGKRPSSRHDDLGFSHDRSTFQNASQSSHAHGRNSSESPGSLATLPPPVPPPEKTPAHRNSLFLKLAAARNRETDSREDATAKRGGKTRRCCGCPLWAMILLIFLILCLIAVAVAVPLKLVVFKKKDSGMSIQECQKSLNCLHGGINVVLEETCSCICTNGYAGTGCDIAGSRGCVVSNLIATDGSSRINNATIGSAVPRLVVDSPKNFSISLSATVILARFNAANLSCIAENSLVTFDRQDTRLGAADTPVEPTNSATSTNGDKAKSRRRRDIPDESVMREMTPRSAYSPAGSGSMVSSAEFVVTEETLDFARTVVLYVLQQDSIESATRAHDMLQDFFNQAALGASDSNGGVTVQEASNLAIGGSNSVDLVSATVNLGQSITGHEKIPKLSGMTSLAVIAGAF